MTLLLSIAGIGGLIVFAFFQIKSALKDNYRQGLADSEAKRVEEDGKEMKVFFNEQEKIRGFDAEISQSLPLDWPESGIIELSETKDCDSSSEIASSQLRAERC